MTPTPEEIADAIYPCAGMHKDCCHAGVRQAIATAIREAEQRGEEHGKKAGRIDGLRDAAKLAYDLRLKPLGRDACDACEMVANAIAAELEKPT